MNILPDQHIGSFVFVLRAHHSHAVSNHMGRAVQQCFLKMIADFDPALAEQFHDGTTGVRPYTVSGLFRLGKTQIVRGAIAAEEQVWFRITALNDTAFDALKTLANTRVDTPVEIDNATWTLETVDASSGGWAQQSSYMLLLTEHAATRPAFEIRLTFDAPTGFHTKGATVPFPMPTLLFESLMTRWSAFSPIVLPELLHPFVDQHLSIRAFEGATRSILQKNGHPEIGFVGEVTYALVRRNPTLHKVDPRLSRQLEAQYTPLAQAINLLAAFALFSGVGIKTASGMGVTRLMR